MGGERKPIIGITMGDPGGIGAEIIVKSLTDPAIRSLASYRIFGCENVMAAAAKSVGIAPFWKTSPSVEWHQVLSQQSKAVGEVLLLDYGPYRYAPGAASEDGDIDAMRAMIEAGNLSLQFCEDAIQHAKGKESKPRLLDGIVTAPICKQHWAIASKGKWTGHTELFGSRFGADRYGMMFVSPVLRVILHTIHIPLRDVASSLKPWYILDTIRLGYRACVELGIAKPRIAVCGVNPHAGENGLIGREDAKEIAPAIKDAKKEGINASGPHPGDTVFNKARLDRHGCEFDMVVAMYHDQGLIPLKLLAWDSAVNMTVGIPVPRTSPDHGTAFDIAGKNKADAGSMKAAIRTAVEVATGNLLAQNP